MIKRRIQPYTGRIKKPGIYSGMPMTAYHSGEAAIEPSISSTGLRKIFNASPLHYWINSPYNKDRIEDEDTDALRFGRAAHHLLFGQEHFKKLFAVPPETMAGEPFSLRRKICKIWREQREAEGRTYLAPAEVTAIEGMRDSLAGHPLIQHGLLNGEIETSWFCKHQKTGIWLKVRPDAAPSDDLVFVDLKTTSSIEYRDLQRTILEHGYYIQAGLVAMVVWDILGVQLAAFTFVFIEKKPPYDIAIVTLKDNEIARGVHAANLAIERFAECLKSGVWPGRYADQDQGQFIEMPEWAQQSIDAKFNGK